MGEPRVGTYAARVAERVVAGPAVGPMRRGGPVPALARLAFAAETRLHRALSAAARRAGWSASVFPYPGYGGGDRVRVLSRVLLVPPGSDTGNWRDMPGWRRFLTLEQPDAEVTVEVAGARKVVRSDEAGHVDTTVEVALPPGRATARLRTGQSPSVPAPVYVASPAAPRGVVCDIDDTVWVTGLRYPVRAAWRTFVEAGSGRRPVPGMATLLRGLVRGGADAPGDLPQHRAVEPRGCGHPVPAAPRLPVRGAADDRLGLHPAWLVPRRACPQAGRAGPPRGRPARRALGARRRRRAARPGDLRRVRQAASGAGCGNRPAPGCARRPPARPRPAAARTAADVAAGLSGRGCGTSRARRGWGEAASAPGTASCRGRGGLGGIRLA